MRNPFKVGNYAKVISKDDSGWVEQMDETLGKVYKVLRVGTENVVLSNKYMYHFNSLVKVGNPKFTRKRKANPWRRIVL